MGYLTVKSPFPYPSRDLCLASTDRRDDDGTWWLTSASVQHVRCPAVKGKARARLVCGGTVIVPLGPTACRVVHMVAIDYQSAAHPLLVVFVYFVSRSPLSRCDVSDHQVPCPSS